MSLVAATGDALAPLRRALLVSAGAIERDLPWIAIGDPWAVVVSEFMLQQTQVARVIAPWERFMASFPTPAACAAAPLASVVRHWEGLGFHRRAKFLHDAAKAMVERHGGKVPADPDALRALPGIGPYTANAVASFAFGAPVGVLDTNVGRVLARAVANRPLTTKEAQAMADALVPPSDSARFNQALLDLGAQFCASSPRCETCPVRRICRWQRDGGDDPAPRSAGVSKKQSPFAGSDRQIRGRLLATLREKSVGFAALCAAAQSDDVERIRRCLDGLESDGLVVKRGRTWALAGESR